MALDRKPAAGFDVRHEDVLTMSAAEAMRGLDPARWLVAFQRSSPQARALLRELGLSYASANGELYIHAPPIHVELPARVEGFPAIPRGRSSAFAIRASRVPRWLLLNPQARPSVSELAVEVDLDVSVVSRTLRTLQDESYLSLELDQADSRRRQVRLRKAGAMLDAFERADANRRVSRRSWDVGAREPERAMQTLRRVATRTSLSYVLGGLAGAAMLIDSPGPAAIDVWIRREDLGSWVDELDARPWKPSPGAVTFRALPDPFVISLGRRRKGLWIADSVQLFLDCRQAGERALDAAEAIRREMHW